MDHNEHLTILAKLAVIAAEKYGAQFKGKSIYGVQGEGAECQIALAEELGYKSLAKFTWENQEKAREMVKDVV